MNFRVALCLAVAMVVSIILASCLFVSQNSRLALMISLGVIFSTVLICVVIFKKRFLMFLLSIILFIALPVVMIYTKANELSKNNLLISETTTYSGKIYSYSEQLEANALFIELDDVKILTGKETKDFKGIVYVRVYADGVDTSKLEVGKNITIKSSNLKGLTLKESVTRRDRSYLSRGMTATDFVFAYNLYFGESEKLGLRDNIKNSVLENFDKTDTFFTSIGYAMIFGESSVLNDDVYSVFKDSGIAHLLAVSGFHISVIVAFLSFVLNKLKVNKHLKISIIAVILSIYAYLCSFSVSVIRASIMALLLLYATNRNKEYDKMSALSLAAIIILLINPLQLFNLSFIFSFVSILSIILLAPLFERLLSKILYDKLSSSIGISLAVCLGVMVFQLYYFGKVPLFSVLSNVITIPVVSVLFIFLIISVIVGGVFNIMVPLINVFGFLMKYVVQFNNWICSSGLNIYCGDFEKLTFLLSLAIMFIVSDYLFVKKKTKLIVALPLFMVLIVSMI